MQKHYTKTLEWKAPDALYVLKFYHLRFKYTFIIARVKHYKN